jgi:hypothetical protein
MSLGSQIREHLNQLSPSSHNQKTSESTKDFQEVVLTDDEIEAALQRAREEKYYLQKRISYLEALNTPIERKKYTSEQIKDFLSQVITIDNENESVVWKLCLYFSGDERFEKMGYKLDKGLCLFGGVGVGKTTLMEKFCQNQRQSYIMKMCRALEDEFAKDGDEVLREYGIYKQTTINGDPYGHQVLGYCFDDLGTEPVSKYYGKTVDVMAEILLNRYDNRLPFTQTHITTNLSTDEILQRYGTRVADRMQQMFNMITFGNDAKSRRR